MASRQHPSNTARLGRHGRRVARSSLTGPFVKNPTSRVARFDADSRSVVHYLQTVLPELRQIDFRYVTMPADASESEMPKYYAIDRERRTITLFRVPIQRARGLHVDDEDHRRMFIGHCVYRAACEYLGRSPWDLLPGQFDHY